MQVKTPRNHERSFGLSAGLLLGVGAVFIARRGFTATAVGLAVTGIGLFALGRIAPHMLTAPSLVWWRVLGVVGAINARILLTGLFAIVLVPLATIWRVAGKDPLARRRASWSGWQPYPARYRDRQHYSRMY